MAARASSSACAPCMTRCWPTSTGKARVPASSPSGPASHARRSPSSSTSSRSWCRHPPTRPHRRSREDHPVHARRADALRHLAPSDRRARAALGGASWATQLRRPARRARAAPTQTRCVAPAQQRSPPTSSRATRHPCPRAPPTPGAATPPGSDRLAAHPSDERDGRRAQLRVDRALDRVALTALRASRAGRFARSTA